MQHLGRLWHPTEQQKRVHWRFNEPFRGQFVKAGSTLTYVRSILLESIVRRVMIPSRLNQRDLAQGGTFRAFEGRCSQNEDATYITQASISLYPPRSINTILPPPPSSAERKRMSSRRGNGKNASNLVFQVKLPSPGRSVSLKLS